MKVETLEIVWHKRDPVLSIDIHESGRVATAGADCAIRVLYDPASACRPAFQHCLIPTFMLPPLFPSDLEARQESGKERAFYRRPVVEPVSVWRLRQHYPLFSLRQVSGFRHRRCKHDNLCPLRNAKILMCWLDFFSFSHSQMETSSSGK